MGLATVPALQAQSGPTAVRKLDLSAFGMFSGVRTGLGSSPFLNANGLVGPEGRNLAITAGADLGFYSLRGFRLGAEVRGSIAVDSGQVDGQKSVLGGIRVTHEPTGYGFWGGFRPYGTVLAGRGELNYGTNGYPLNGITYLSSISNVYAGGGGIEYDFSRRFSLKLDGQVQRWNTPVLASGVIYSKQGSIGIVYRYGTGRGPR